MATSLQERLKLKQCQVDTWTTREQLCLASAVLKSGDQNWAAVRRNIKMLTTEHSRPHDWYSTKNCALQYTKLLEQVDTPKRKRERGDFSNETPSEIVTKMLTKQRIDELTTLVAEEKVAYNHHKKEIQDLESGRLDHQLDALWDQFLKERAEEEEEEKRHLQWLKEREEKITAIQQALKQQGPKVNIPPNKKKNKPPWPSVSNSGARRNSGLSETSSELDSALDSPDIHEPTEAPGQDGGTQEPEAKPTPTSPLLSSLLSKSPIMPGSSTSPLSQGRAMRPGLSPVSMALQNLVSSAISGTDVVTKSTTPPGSGSSTLSRLLDLPPTTPGGPLPKLSDLTSPSYDTKETEKIVSTMKESKDTKSCSPDGKGPGCRSLTETLTLLDTNQEKESPKPAMDVVEKLDEKKGDDEKKVGGGGEGEREKEGESEEKFENSGVKEEAKEEPDKGGLGEEEKPPKNEVKSETDCSFSSETNLDSEVTTKKECEMSGALSIGQSTGSSACTPASEKGERALKLSRDFRKKEEKKKEKRLDADVKEESTSETSSRMESKEAEDVADIKEDKSNKIEKLEDYEQESESKDWMSEDDGVFQRSGKRKSSGGDFLGYSPLVCESAPTSPASTHYGDDPESERSYKSWKKPIMILWNEIAAHRFASIFLRPITDEQAPGYHSVVYRPMDLQTIKRNIESGMIRNTAEFQRDMMLMFLNAIMYNTSDHNVHQMAHQMMQDTIATIEEFLNTQMLARAEETPQKSLRRETRESSAKRSDDDLKRKRDHPEEKSTKKRR